MKYFSFDSKVQGEQNEKIRVCSCKTELWLIHTGANLSILLGEKKRSFNKHNNNLHVRHVSASLHDYNVKLLKEHEYILFYK